MKLVFAYECYADRDVFRFLRENTSLHDVFIRALRQLYAEARARRKSIFLTELVAMLENVPRK